MANLDKEETFKGILEGVKNMSVEEYEKLFHEVSQEEIEQMHQDSVTSLTEEEWLGNAGSFDTAPEQIARTPIAVENIASFGDLENLRNYMLGNGLNELTVKITTVFSDEKDISVEVVK